MKIKILFILFALLLGASCSSKNDSRSKNGSESVDAVKDSSDFIVDSEEDDLFIDEESDVEVASTFNEEEKPKMIAETSQGDMQQYTVAEGETLMVIAFKLFGDYRKWRSLKSLNPQINEFALQAGEVLQYETQADIFSWSPNGSPYLIKGGDTLGSISEDKYGTEDKWKVLWDNNKPMIRDPNLIFAGFTLYYVSDDVAVQ